VMAARLVWMLRAIGHDAALLDGGIGAYDGPLDPRAGHIPGARSLPARENVDEAGRFLPVDELRRRLVAVGIDSPDTPVVSSCGSGVTACHNLLVMEHAGVGDGRLYPGSWSQWANDPERPVETGETLS
jgi:thiosulfate/3-mercaptopyruvate sulfurtransferase